MEPETAMVPHNLARLNVDDATFLFAHELTQKVVVVYLAQETDALTVLAAGTGQSCLDGNLPDFLLH